MDFEGGHRRATRASGADWPNTWPPPGGRHGVDRATVELELPVLDGPSPRLQPVSPRNGQGAAHGGGRRRGADAWTITRDVLGREARAAISYGSTYEALFDAHVSRALRRRGRRLDRPTRRTPSHGATLYRVTGPRPTWSQRLGSRCARTPTRTTSPSTPSSRRSATPASAGVSGASNASFPAGWRSQAGRGLSRPCPALDRAVTAWHAARCVACRYRIEHEIVVAAAFDDAEPLGLAGLHDGAARVKAATGRNASRVGRLPLKDLLLHPLDLRDDREQRARVRDGAGRQHLLGRARARRSARGT